MFGVTGATENSGWSNPSYGDNIYLGMVIGLKTLALSVTLFHKALVTPLEEIYFTR